MLTTWDSGTGQGFEIGFVVRTNGVGDMRGFNNKEPPFLKCTPLRYIYHPLRNKLIHIEITIIITPNRTLIRKNISFNLPTPLTLVSFFVIHHSWSHSQPVAPSYRCVASSEFQQHNEGMSSTSQSMF